MKILEVHNGLSALLVQQSDYEGIWISSLTHSASKGLPDNELVTLRERITFVDEIRKLTTKPIFVDIDTGGNLEHLPRIIQGFQLAGAYGVVMEDKKGTKQNSLLEKAKHELEDIDTFSEKIKVAKQNANGLKIYARLESLIAQKSKYETLLRAKAYLEAGADGIMVHSKVKVDASEVIEVGNKIKEEYPNTRLIAVPTTYTLPEKHPFDIIIEANQLLRVSITAMKDYIEGKLYVRETMASVQDIFNLTGH